MAADHPVNGRHVDRDGVIRVKQKRAGPGVWLVGGAGAVLVGCLALSAWLALSQDPVEPGPARPPPTVRRSPPPLPVERPATSPRRPDRPLAPPPVEASAPAEPPSDTLPPRDEAPQISEDGSSGLGLFVHGIEPLKKGLMVPEDFELPPGYVRHYQTTDDGQMLPAILMFHADHNPVDANGKPIPIPEDRVVPPEMAPPGLPVEMLELPKERRESGR